MPNYKNRGVIILVDIMTVKALWFTSHDQVKRFLKRARDGATNVIEQGGYVLVKGERVVEDQRIGKLIVCKIQLLKVIAPNVDCWIIENGI